MKRCLDALLDLVPSWFRSRWPLRRFYWQKEEIEQIQREADKLQDMFG